MTTLWVRRIAWLAVALIAAWLLSMTLRPGRAREQLNLEPFSEKRPALECLLADCPAARRSFQFLFIDVLGNVAVFMPLGAALTAATLPDRSKARRRRRVDWRRWLSIIVIAALFSLGIELAQLWVPGRATDIDDLILNTLGALIGAGLMQGLILIFRGKDD